MRTGYAIRRVAAYAQGQIEFGRLAAEPTFRDFVCLYMAEGYKRSRNTVSVCNSDPAIVVLCAFWVRQFARNPVKYSVQYHADQELDDLQSFWAERLLVAPEEIRLVPKSNSGRLSGRTWRSRYGVLSIYAGDTLFRSRLQAWMDCLQEQWLKSANPGA
jgi:hypothetical protein